MKLLSAILLLLLTGISSITHAAEDDKTIKSSRDFSLRCRSLNAENAQRSENVQEKSISVKVYSEYNSKDQTIEIGFEDLDTSEESFTLKYPLNFEVFQQKFDSLLSKDKKEELLASYGSHLDVFYWIVTITEDHNLPLAGVLTTSQYVMISSDNGGKNLNHTERSKLVKNEIDSLEVKKAKLRNSELKLKELAEQGETSLETDSDKIKKVIQSKNDSLDILNSHIQTIKSNIPSIHEPAIRSALISDTLKKQDTINLIKNNIDLLKKALDQIKAKLSALNDKDLFTAINIHAQKAVIDQSIRMQNLSIRKVSHVQYQFEKGYLERIQVHIESPETDNKEIFENAYPIGFSSISNYGNFTAIRLYRRSNKFDNDSKNNYIFLSDIIKLYENQLNLATRDYSPGDTTVTVDPGSNPITQLTKQRNFYIIDGKTFTDVTGLSEDSPNGLVQVELSRRFNLWTHRIQVHGPNNYGFVNYVNAKVNFSKIENKLKGLPLRNQLIVENNAIVSPSYATNLDYLRYENLGMTLDLNLFLFDAPDFKYTFFLDAGIHYGHTPIIDSNYQITQGIATTNKTVNNLDAHNFTFFPRAKLQLFAERRYGISLSYQANYTWLFTNNRFKQVLSYSGKGQDLNTLSTNKASHWSHMIEAAFYIDVNPRSSTGKIFTTARFFFQQGDVNTFYPQILLGYAFNIFK